MDLKMDLNRHVQTAWSLTLKHIVSLLFLTLVWMGLSILTLGILAPAVTAGYVHSLHRMLREGREPRIQDVFSQMRLFFPLLGFAIGAFLVSMLGYMLMVIPGIVVTLAIVYACFFVIPLMTDRHLGLIAAVQESWEMARRGSQLDHLLAVIIVAGLTMVGFSVVVAWLFTQPLATVFMLSVYEEKIASSSRPPESPSQA